MTEAPCNIALYYDDSAYVEMLRRPDRPAPGGPLGLMGRQVAGKAFLDAYLAHGNWDALVAVVRQRAGADPLVRLCQEHPSSRSRKRRLSIVAEQDFRARFFPDPPARLLHLPAPPDPRFAWARQHGGDGRLPFALCGVTHTLCSAPAVHHLGHLVTAPFEPCDALICTSRAVLDMVRAVTDTYAGYLRERLGAAATPFALRPRLEVIPLGVDTDRLRPPTETERAASRRALHVADEEVMVLFVGRLSYHAKAHPFPMFRALSRAARAAGRKAHLVLAGWAARDTIRRAFTDGARLFAPNVRVSLADGTRPEVRAGVWHAADLFVSLADNLQETFGLTPVEAMAGGLPVVASDWDGYRDLVVDGQTGYLIPTTMVRDATADVTARLLLGEVNYEHFLGACSQAAAVDPAAAAEALTRLLADADLRRRMGAAGRRRAEELFAWPRIIRAYEALWAEQEAVRAGLPARDPGPAPSCYPPPEHTFAGYPAAWLGEADVLQAVPENRAELEALLRVPWTRHGGGRCLDPAVLRAALDAARDPCPLSRLDAVLRAAGVGHVSARATVAWLLKYDLLRTVRE